MKPVKVNDLRWSVGGDLVIGSDGDLCDTKASSYLSFIQEIKTRLQSDLYDWKTQPHIGASLSDLQGEPNNQDTAEEGRTRITTALTKDDLVSIQSLKVSYLPVDINHIMYKVTINLAGFSTDEQIVLNALLDVNEYELMFV